MGKRKRKRAVRPSTRKNADAGVANMALEIGKDGWHALAVAVVLMAVRDAHKRGQQAHEARVWLCSQDGAAWAQRLGIDPAHLSAHFSPTSTSRAA